MRKRLLIPAGLIAAGLALAGCGGSDDSGGGSGDHNDADVEFATEMIPHHEQALLMVDMTEGRSLSPEFEDLTSGIEAAQAPEIETMTGWLEDWDEEVPELGMDGMDMEGMDMDGMGGLLDESDLDALQGAVADGFERMWLVMMIEHHEGAIEMARDEIEDGEFGPAVELAESIVESQSAEIDRMEEMLGS